jgi:hypothetical protein
MGAELGLKYGYKTYLRLFRVHYFGLFRRLEIDKDRVCRCYFAIAMSSAAGDWHFLVNATSHPTRILGRATATWSIDLR